MFDYWSIRLSCVVFLFWWKILTCRIEIVIKSLLASINYTPRFPREADCFSTSRLDDFSITFGNFTFFDGIARYGWFKLYYYGIYITITGDFNHVILNKELVIFHGILNYQRRTNHRWHRWIGMNHRCDTPQAQGTAHDHLQRDRRSRWTIPVEFRLNLCYNNVFIWIYVFICIYMYLYVCIYMYLYET